MGLLSDLERVQAELDRVLTENKRRVCQNCAYWRCYLHRNTERYLTTGWAPCAGWPGDWIWRSPYFYCAGWAERLDNQEWEV